MERDTRLECQQSSQLGEGIFNRVETKEGDVLVTLLEAAA